MGNSDDDESIFESFTGENLVKADSDLDTDFDALLRCSRSRL